MEKLVINHNHTITIDFTPKEEEFGLIYQNTSISTGTMNPEHLIRSFMTTAICMEEDGFMDNEEKDQFRTLRNEYETCNDDDDLSMILDDLWSLVDEICNEYGYAVTTNPGDPADIYIASLEDLEAMEGMF